MCSCEKAKDRSDKGPKWMSRSVLRTEVDKDRTKKGPNLTSTSVLGSKMTEVDKDRSGKGPKWIYNINTRMWLIRCLAVMAVYHVVVNIPSCPVLF